MPSSDEIRDAIKKLGMSNGWLVKQEIAALPSVLWEDELIAGAIQGHYNDRAGLLVATQRRLIFIDKGWASLRVEDFPYDQITSIQYATGMVFGEIIIFAAGNNAKISQLAKAETLAFADIARNHVNKLSALTPQPGSPAAAPAEQRLAMLERLALLKQQGILSDEELADIADVHKFRAPSYYLPLAHQTMSTPLGARAAGMHAKFGWLALCVT